MRYSVFRLNTIDVTKRPPHCVDGTLNNNETDIDCGGECFACALNQSCLINLDCQSGRCDPASKVCLPARCDDLLRDGEETDVDCGGPICGATCINGKSCLEHLDCQSGFCNAGQCAEADACHDGILTGAESDIDCGGACPDRCQQGQSCITVDDCAVGLACADGACQVCAQGDLDCDGIIDDSDFDGVRNEDDACPNTPVDEPVDENGCGASQRDSDLDGMSDACELRYGLNPDDPSDALEDPDNDGLTNRQECVTYKTNPKRADTDGDGASDKKEVNAGTDPLDPNDFPKGRLGTVLFIIFILIVLSAGGYFGYKYYPQLKARFAPKPAKPITVTKVVKPKVAPPAKPPKLVKPKEWLSLKDLSKHLGKEDVSASIFGKLKQFEEGKLAKEEHLKLVEQIRGHHGALDKLRSVALGGMSARERKIILKKLRLLEKGKLTTKQIEALFRKLKITAEYYEKHKAELMRDLE